MEVNRLDAVYDLLVIGGGINGTGIAADAAGRGLDVVLCEKDDLASATSSWSTKLIHGGLRYLEGFQFGMVRKSLREREILTKAAPHIVKPIAFHIPILPHSRSRTMLSAGLFMYDNLARRDLYKGSRKLRFPNDGPLNDSIKSGFEYWDGQVDDSRLVILNALQAHNKGALIMTRSEVVAIQPEGDTWKVQVRDRQREQDLFLRCRVLVNASGPWVADLLSRLTRREPRYKVRQVKGSHILVPKIYQGDQAYLLQHHDGRVIFVIPYLNKYSLIGTTEVDFEGDLDRVTISNEEVNYLISLTNLYFKKSVLRSDIVHTYSGVRPLMEEKGKSSTRTSRDYFIELIEDPLPLMSVYGGKVTTYRALAENVLNELGHYFPRMRGSWTRRAHLPGGNFTLPEDLFRELASKYAWLGPDVINRWQSSYGTISFDILKETRNLSDMGVSFSADLFQREVDYLCKNEWAKSANDILWRRTKLGLKFGKKEKDSLENYIRQTYG